MATTEPAPSLVVDCSAVIGIMSEDQVKALEKEAIDLLMAGNAEGAQKVMGEVQRIRSVAESDATRMVELEGEALDQWHKDQEDGKENRLFALRQERNARLAMSDWTQIEDAALGSEEREQWKKYRQTLRNWPQTVEDPMDPPDWPAPPQ